VDLGRCVNGAMNARGQGGWWMDAPLQLLWPLPGTAREEERAAAAHGPRPAAVQAPLLARSACEMLLSSSILYTCTTVSLVLRR
jgi:hypothetical protein